MKRKLLFVVALVLVAAGIALPTTSYADAPTPANQIAVDITINDRGEISIGGLSMTQMGLGRINDPTTALLKQFNDAHLVLQGEMVTVDVKGQPLVKVQWAPESRQILAKIATNYGVQMTSDLQTRLEQWISTSNVDVTARFSNEASKPLVAKVVNPVLVDFGANGQVIVEKMPLAYGIDPSVFQYVRMAGVSNATFCWNKGTLVPAADGKPLPSITVYPKGLALLSQVLHLNIESSLDPFFNAQIGADVNMPGGARQAGFTCKYE